MDRIIVAAVVLTAVIGGAALTASAGPAVAADNGKIPSLPAEYHGSLSLSDGSLHKHVKIVAVADGEVQASMITDTNGSFGGPDIGDKKMEVQKPDSGQVHFRVGGEPVTVKSLDGKTINKNTIQFKKGDQHLELVADSSQVQPNATVNLSTNSPVDAGNRLSVNVSVKNTGPVNISDTLQLQDYNGTTVDSKPVDVAIGGSTTTTLTWRTNGSMTGRGNVTVQLGDESATTAVTVKRIEPPQIAPPPSGGGGAPAGSGATTTTHSGNSTDNGSVGAEPPGHIETQPIVNSKKFNMSQVRFTKAANVVSITWDGTTSSGNVTITSPNQPGSQIATIPGAAVLRSNVSVPASLINRSATVQFRVTLNQLDELNANASDLRIFRYTDAGWKPLDTRIVKENANVIRLQTVSSGVSAFAVSAVGTPKASITVNPQTPTAGENFSLNGSTATTQYGRIVAYNWTVNGHSLSGPTVETSVNNPGRVNATLVVKNDAGESATVTKSVQIAASTTSTTTTNSTPGFTIVTALCALLIIGMISRRMLR